MAESYFDECGLQQRFTLWITSMNICNYFISIYHISCITVAISNKMYIMIVIKLHSSSIYAILVILHGKF